MTTILETMSNEIDRIQLGNKNNSSLNQRINNTNNNRQQIIAPAQNNHIPTGEQAPRRTIDLNDINLYEDDSSSSSSEDDSDGYFSDAERSPVMVIQEAVIFDSAATPQNPAQPAVDNTSTIDAHDIVDAKIETYRHQLASLLEQCTAKSLNDLRPEVNEDDAFRIRFIDPQQRPIACKARPLPHHIRASVKAAIDSQLEAGIIRPSYSAWASALHVVHKPDFSIRITVDYKPLNKVILVDQYPLPSISTLYAKLGLMKYFSKIDMKSAYHQIPVHEDSIEYTAFICEFGLYEYLSMPMGINTAPAWFQRFIERVLADFTSRNVLSVYIDDIMIFTDNIDEHYYVVKQVLERLMQRSLKASGDKSKLFTIEIEFLGQIISNGIIRAHPRRAECIVNMPRPKTVADLQRLLGMTNYSRIYIPKYAEIVQPLYDLMNLKEVPAHQRKRSNGAVDGKKVFLDWNDITLRALERLKNAMCSDLVLALPNFELEFILTTDASDFGYGAVLEQEMNCNNRIIAFFSRCYTAAQRKYATSEKELLAIIKSVENWKVYLYGRKFTIYTDHQPLIWLINKKNPHPRLERWNMQLSVYQYEIKYKKGKDNLVADALSRLPDESDIDPNTNEDYLDILIANISDDMGRFPEGEEDESHKDSPTSSSENNVLAIASQPTSRITNLYESCLEEQNKDEDIVWVKNLILTHKENRPKINTFSNAERKVFYKEYTNLRVIDGIVYRSIEDFDGHNRTQYVLPKQIIAKTLDIIHTTAYSGHLGRRKTLKIVSERFYRPFLPRDVIEYVRTCDLCQKVKVTSSDKTAEMQIILPSRTNELVSTDFTGPFKVTERGNKYLIVIVDCFSKYMVSKPLPNKETITAAQAVLESWCWTFGIPERLLSDKGGEYDSCLFDAVCNLLDVDRVNTTPFHPQGDGQSEKAVQQIKRMIRAHIDEKQDNWDIGVSQLCFSYNSSVHAITGLSPFHVMFGRECRIPIDLIFPNTLSLNREQITEKKKIEFSTVATLIELAEDTQVKEIEIFPDVTIDEIESSYPTEAQHYVTELKQRLSQCFETLQRNKMWRMGKHKAIYDRKIRKKSYNIGDWVLCNHPQLKKGLSRGLAPRFHGPFIIVGKYANGCDYLIRPHNQPRAKVRQMHQNNLKFYFRRGHPSDTPKIRDSSENDDAVPTKRTYHKDPLNPRWNKAGAQATEEPYDAEASNTSDASSEVESSVDQDETSPDSEPAPARRPPGRPQGAKNKVTAPTIPTSSSSSQKYITKSGRITRARPKYK